MWNTVVPALGLALLLGAPVLPAIALAGAASIAIIAFASKSRREPAGAATAAHGRSSVEPRTTYQAAEHLRHAPPGATGLDVAQNVLLAQ